MEKWTPAANILCYTSDDAGQSWKRGQTAPSPELVNGKPVMLQEPGVVARKDGRLMLWYRTNAGSQYVADSQDQGESWSQPKPSSIISPLAPLPPCIKIRTPAIDASEIALLLPNRGFPSPVLERKKPEFRLLILVVYGSNVASASVCAAVSKAGCEGGSSKGSTTALRCHIWSRNKRTSATPKMPKGSLGRSLHIDPPAETSI